MIFPRAVIEQEMSVEREIEIPEPVRDVLRQWRPSPLFRARRLEKALDTPAKIYYKYEGVSPAGSHKPNTAIAQAFYNKEEGVKRIERFTGRFYRRFTLPDTADSEHISARSENGILEVSIPKRPEVRSRRITVEH